MIKVKSHHTGTCLTTWKKTKDRKKGKIKVPEQKQQKENPCMALMLKTLHET